MSSMRPPSTSLKGVLPSCCSIETPKIRERHMSDDILAAGQRVLARFGYHGATAERIADEAGVSRVTLHRRGITKDTILAELSARAVDSYRAALWPALTAPGTGAERLEAALTALCNQAEDNLELLVALRSQTDAG